MTQGTADHCIATDLDSVPSELYNHEDWLVARVPNQSGGRKSPIAPDWGSGWNVTSKLFTADEAYLAAEEALRDGRVDATAGDRAALAYRLSADDPYAGIDVDDIDSLDEISELTEEFSDTYIERSVSGQGVHIVVKASLPGVSGSKGSLLDEGEPTVEFYDRNQYLLFTGSRITDTSGFSHAQDRVDDLFDRVGVSSDEEDRTSQESSSNGITAIGRKNARRYASGASHSDPDPTADQVIATALDSDDDLFERLFRGRPSGNPSPSEDDSALAYKLAFWCRGDLALMDECFRKSALYDCRDQNTPKWDEVHYASGETYGAMTLENAVMQNSGRYSGSYVDLNADRNS
jgi:putative DNA primase/helicase